MAEVTAAAVSAAEDKLHTTDSIFISMHSKEICCAFFLTQTLKKYYHKSTNRFIKTSTILSRTFLKRGKAMNKHTADVIIASYVKKLFGFAMSKLSKIDEAEELAAEITFQVYASLLKQDNIENLDGYIYRIAKNVYSRHIDSKNKSTAVDSIEYIPDSKDFAAELMNSETCGILRREITYLSKIQREIIVQHYFHDKKVKEIAAMLSLNENTVKWHLACSRKELKTGMERTRTTGTLGTEPIKFRSMGHNGHPGSKGDTSDFLAKVITQNIAYAAYHQPRTINEIAEELGINPIFVEDEVAVLEEYGYMDKLSSGKYRTNIRITIPNETRYRIYREIEPKYSKLFAEKFFVPILENITEIPEWLHVPDNDINLLKWSMVCFLAHKLATADIYDNKFSVKRPDGGDFVAYAVVDVKPDWDMSDAEPNIYWACGDMWRDRCNEEVWWKSWQLDCHWCKREGLWRDNLTEDYDKMYFWLNNQLPQIASNAESYARLLEKGYLLKDGDSYKCNIILCDSEQKWWKYIPEATEEITALSREYAAEALKAELYGQPEHMHELIRYYNQNCACMFHTRVMKILLDMGVLKMPTEDQAKGLCTIMFMGE
ncbi:MAG: RNA polymerase sigma factor [Oscillospiraceae bacterium]|nr:RNA polymerase sigma factor [Oscillospiraceae bacterium]